MRGVPDVFSDVREFLGLPGLVVLRDVEPFSSFAGGTADGG